jgi:hypothetical protein
MNYFDIKHFINKLSNAQFNQGNGQIGIFPQIMCNGITIQLVHYLLVIILKFVLKVLSNSYNTLIK